MKTKTTTFTCYTHSKTLLIVIPDSYTMTMAVRKVTHSKLRHCNTIDSTDLGNITDREARYEASVERAT